jgi:hypothetical protein
MSKEDPGEPRQSLQDALERLKNGMGRPDDMQIVEQALALGQITVALEGAIAIGGNASGNTLSTLAHPQEARLQKISYQQPRSSSSIEANTPVATKFLATTSFEARNVFEKRDVSRATATAYSSSTAIGRDARNNVFINIKQMDPNSQPKEISIHEDSIESLESQYAKPKLSEDYEQIYEPHRKKLCDIIDMDMRILEEGIISDQQKIREYLTRLKQLDDNPDEKMKLEGTIQEIKRAKDSKMAELRTQHLEFTDFANLRGG